MKRIIISIFFATAAVMLFSRCNDFLNVEPESSISPETYWKSKDDATFWINGIYREMQLALTENWYYWGESRSDNAIIVGTGAAQTTMVMNRLGSMNGSGLDWYNPYRVISLCNTALKQLPEMIEKNVESSADTYKEYMGQCYAMRAMMYFYIIRIWGRAPIVTEPIEGLARQTEFPRSSIAELRALIESDLNKALETIGLAVDNNRKYYLTKPAVYAIYTDLYAWFQEYDKVISMSGTLMGLSGSGYISNPSEWKNIFLTPESSPENIFVMYWNSTEAATGMGAGRLLGNTTNTSNYGLNGDLLRRLFDRYRRGDLAHSDVRLWACFDTLKWKSSDDYNSDNNSIAGTGRKFGKFTAWVPGSGFAYEHRDQNSIKMPVYRYVDVATLRAEALTMTGRYDEALAILQKVRARVGWTPTEEEDPSNYMAYYNAQPNKAAALQDAILEERQLEFMGEGKRWFDLCRVGKTAFSKPYYDESGSKPYKLPSDAYLYLRSKVNSIRMSAIDYGLNQASRGGHTDYEGDNVNRVLFPIAAAAFTANPQLRGDQNYPYEE
ncbi:MAG: RagB/SusD family nutrient uptake outer membrane protein [Mangrovibacterium sp.]